MNVFSESSLRIKTHTVIVTYLLFNFIFDDDFPFLGVIGIWPAVHGSTPSCGGKYTTIFYVSRNKT